MRAQLAGNRTWRSAALGRVDDRTRPGIGQCRRPQDHMAACSAEAWWRLRKKKREEAGGRKEGRKEGTEQEQEQDGNATAVRCGLAATMMPRW